MNRQELESKVAKKLVTILDRTVEQRQAYKDYQEKRSQQKQRNFNIPTKNKPNELSLFKWALYRQLWIIAAAG